MSSSEARLSSKGQKVRIEEEERIGVRETFRKQQVEQVITTHYNFSSLRLGSPNASSIPL